MKFYYPSNKINQTKSYDPRHSKQQSFIVADINHCFGVAIHSFKEMITEQLKPQIEKFNFTYIKSRLPLNEYRMRFSKYLLIKPRPLLALAVSIDSTYDGGFLKSDAFKAELSKVLDVRNFTSPIIITDNDVDNPGGNTMVSMSVKRHRLFIEVTIALGSRGQALNAWNFWNAVSVPEFIERQEMIIEFPLPRSVVKAYAKAHNLLDEKGEYDMGKVYRDMQKHSVYPIDYKNNTSTGLDEIFVKYMTPVDYKVVESTFSDGELDGHMYRNFQLFRRYELEITMPNHLYFSPFIYRFVELPKQPETVAEKDIDLMVMPAGAAFNTSDMIEFSNVNPPTAMKPIAGEQVVTTEDNPEEEAHMVLYKTAMYKYSETNNVAPCKQLLEGDVLFFVNDAIKDGVMDDKHILVVASDEANRPLTEGLVTIDNVTLDATCNKKYVGKDISTTDILLSIYINADKYNRWLDKNYTEDESVVKYLSIDNLHLM